MIRKRSVLAATLLLAAAAAPLKASAQVQAEGSVKLSISGSGFVGSGSTNLTNIFGISKFGHSGIELGGDVMLMMTRQAATPDIDPFTGEVTDNGSASISTTGFVFSRLSYNFIGQSTLVPFVSVGLGAPVDPNAESTPMLLDLGGGFKKFISDHASFDVQANYQGQVADGKVTWQDGLSLFYGLSFYVGD